MGQICQFSHFPPIFYLQCSQIFCYCTFVRVSWFKTTHRTNLRKGFFLLKWHFLAFLGQKITKMAQKPFFYFEKWKLFWHTLIIWEDQHFSCFTLFGLVKKVGKNEIFLAFMGQKITKIAKKPFFIFKSGNFFGTP